ncbi:flavin-containing monooxygenase [Parendozoicomonas haliclonae]|uniref:FAD-containing monooxygenase EthA n=1 Tax=Parendozoicomonas haliclonae TaxID=1960125 RepID=A0A1X7AEF7_9GAMM|nr:NAD(P)/FAD-dependent oxidoreductase [Parendozoicomonas haliclonae]SMA32874.1 FAD-containing monooxygenase EthA [Parendozoicomonas haliclonae]
MTESSQAVEHLDVVIIGAGLSGIGAACHLQKQCPGKRYAIIEGRESLGGTWDLFRYPGIRSDSDMYTLGYNFKPWTSPKGIADGPDIRQYITEAAAEHDIERKIRFSQKVVKAQWSSEESRWLLTIKQTETGVEKLLSCNFLLCCTGYYNYAAGYRPEFPGESSFKGEIKHPQQWDENYDYSGKRVVVIGSGATAVTLVPAMTDKAEHVTMLQRSPSYVMTLPQDDPMVNGLRKILPERWVYRITRGRNISISWLIYSYCRAFPNAARKLIINLARKQLPVGYDMKHFSPSYNPWDERLCAVPDGDLFAAISTGKASVATDHIDTFTETGIRLKSGEELEADLIVTATGLDVQMFGGMELEVDGKPAVMGERMCYRGVMFEGVPNLGMTFGYTNASWTLKADLIMEHMCRVLNHMDEHGYRQCTPHNVNDAEHTPFVDMRSGYIQRAAGKIPHQGSKRPWKLYQNYVLDMISLRLGRVDDPSLEFTRGKPSAPARTQAVEQAEEVV